MDCIYCGFPAIRHGILRFTTPTEEVTLHPVCTLCKADLYDTQTEIPGLGLRPTLDLVIDVDRLQAFAENGFLGRFIPASTHGRPLVPCHQVSRR